MKNSVSSIKSVKEALEFAIQREQASCCLYRELASMMNDPVTKMVFDGLLANEFEHIKNLEFEMIKCGRMTNETTFDLSTADMIEIEPDDALRQLTPAEALRMAVRKEKAAFQLYSTMMVQTRNPELRHLFSELAEEEMRHMIKFQEEYDRIATHK